MKSFGITNQTKPFRQYFHKDVSHERSEYCERNPLVCPSKRIHFLFFNCLTKWNFEFLFNLTLASPRSERFKRGNNFPFS